MASIGHVLVGAAASKSTLTVGELEFKVTLGCAVVSMRPTAEIGSSQFR